MDGPGFERVSEVASSFAETNGTQVRVTGKPEEGPPYNGVSIRMNVESIKDAGEKQRKLREALGQAGLLYVETEGDEPSNSPALKIWEVSASEVTFVDMSTERGRFMDAVFVPH